MNGLGIKMLMHIIHFWAFIIFHECVHRWEHIAHLVQSSKLMYNGIYFLNWVQPFYDFGKVVPNGTTQGKVCRGWVGCQDVDV
jgi:hypothetical protein